MKFQRFRKRLTIHIYGTNITTGNCSFNKCHRLTSKRCTKTARVSEKTRNENKSQANVSHKRRLIDSGKKNDSRVGAKMLIVSVSSFI
ncbi:hypothetical protein NPIL_14681 [Nephila pilipes]|uniref:Uncharacterized protein n=1 Tax=Nephila pilipes TaxID=299642 RepID=A0A8X6UA51_NEPPI|nr:hypothetical protein NPIL_14681 [Nephila pilipes]